MIEQFYVDGYDGEGLGFDQPNSPDPVAFLRSIVRSPNIVPMLDADLVKRVGMEVTRGYECDKSSRSEWEKQTKTAVDLALQVVQEKSWPWPKAANIKYPLITTAAIQFSARSYPAIINGSDVVRGEVLGPDPEGSKKERADRIARHMSYQLLEQIKSWDEDEDKLLLSMAIVGCAFRKTYFDTMLGIPCSDLVYAADLVYDHATPWERLRRKTHLLNLYKNDVIERVRGGIFTEIELGLPENASSDEDSCYQFLECHCFFDLDGDGYKEPYIVTVKKDSSEVVRIIARFDEDGIYLNDRGEITKILPVEYFSKFSFMPNPDGGSYDVGLGALLNPINEAINTIFNQLMDAGTLANTGGGFIGGSLKMKGGSARFSPGEFKPVDTNGRIADSIYHMQFPGPSPVLFQLLGMLIQSGKDISSVQDIMVGQQSRNETATTTLALIEQGQKVFSAIFKRVHRGHKEEFKKLFRLNRLYLLPQDYFKFQDRVEQIYLDDYQGDETDVSPVSDPTLASDGQILARAEALLKFVGDPLVDQVEIRENFFSAIKVPNVERFIKKDQPQIPPEIQEKIKQLEAEAQKMQQGVAEKEKALFEQQQQIALAAKDIKAGIAEITAKRRELDLRERLAKKTIEEASLRGEIDAQAKQDQLNELAARKMDEMALAENEIMQRLALATQLVSANY